MTKNIYLIIFYLFLYLTCSCRYDQKNNVKNSVFVKIEIMEFTSSSPIAANLEFYSKNGNLYHHVNTTSTLFEESLFVNSDSLVVSADGYMMKKYDCAQIFENRHKCSDGLIVFTVKLKKVLNSGEYLDDPLQSPGEYEE